MDRASPAESVKRARGVSSPASAPVSAYALAIVLAAAFIVCLTAFFSNHPIPFGTDRIPPYPTLALLTPAFLARGTALFARLGLFWLGAFGVGRLILKAVEPEEPTRLERGVVSLALGAGALGLAAYALGIVHVLKPAILQVLMVLLAAWGLARALPAAPGLGRDISDLRSKVLKMEIIVPLVAIAAVLGYDVLIAMGPTVFYDSLVYHLALPDLYLHRSAMVATPLNAYAGIPAGVEMLYTWLLPWGDFGSPCQLLHLSFAGLTGLSMLAIARRLGKPAAGLWAALIFLATPMVMLAAARPGIELGWSFYVSAALLALMIGDLGSRRRWLLVGGLFAGLALGTKYQAVLLLPAILVLLWSRLGRREGLRASLQVGLIAVAVAVPWGLRNIVFYRNPVFPFGGGVTGIDLPGFIASAHGHSLRDTLTTEEGLTRLLTHPWRYATP